MPGIARLSSRIRVLLKRSPAASPRLALSLFALSSLMAVMVYFYSSFDRPATRRNESNGSPPVPEVRTPSPAPPDTRRESQPAQQPGGSSRPDTPGSILATADDPAARSSAVEPETPPDLRLPPPPALDNPGDLALSAGVSPSREEFLEGGRISVPPEGDAPADSENPRPAPPTNSPADEQRVMSLINQERRSRGLKPLLSDGKLSEVAQRHSRDMARQNYFSHVSRDGKDVSARITNAGLRDWKALGENIAYNKGYEDPSSFAVERWMFSDKHRANILNTKFTHAGVGIAHADDGRVFFTQVLMSR